MQVSKPPTSRQSRLLYALFFLTFVLYGGTVTVIGAVLPRIIVDFQWSYTVTGLVLAAGAVGFFVSSFVSGLVLERVNSKPVFIVSLCVCAAALALFARSSSPVVNLLLYMVVGITQGVFEVVINFGVVRLEKPGQSRLMNLIHMGFSIGAVLSPIGQGVLLRSSNAWTLIFSIIAFLLVVLAGVFTVTRFPAPEAGPREKKSGGISFLKQPLFILLCLAALLYIGSELGASNWVSEYFVRIIGTGQDMAAYAVSMLWVGLFVGRLLISAFLHKKREERLLLVLSLACATLLLALLGSRSTFPAMLVVFGLGIGYSGIYPLVMSLTGKAFRSTAAVGILTTWAGVGGFVFPFLLAGISQGMGLRVGFLMLAALPLGITAISIVIIRGTGRVKK